MKEGPRQVTNDPEASDPGGVHGVPIHGDVNDDEEVLMIPRVPRPSATQIAEHELVGSCILQKLVPPLRCVEWKSARTHRMVAQLRF